MRLRKQNNYKAFFTNSFKTIRLTDSAPLTSELEDVAINDKCLANCSYCYTSALKSGTNFTNIIEKANDVWGSLELNDRPFQIAIGGAGEPTMHPQFIDFLITVRQLEIIPNYTTNGMHLSEEILAATERYCGGVALSWHPHIEKIFHTAVDRLSKINTKLNTHVIVGDKDSLDQLKTLYEKYESVFDYFVILPYQAVGRGKELETKQIWDETFEWISGVKSNKFAFGALFYPYIKDNRIPLDLSIYNPDVYSGYRILNDKYKTLYKSSYELTEKTIACYQDI